MMPRGVTCVTRVTRMIRRTGMIGVLTLGGRAVARGRYVPHLADTFEPLDAQFRHANLEVVHIGRVANMLGEHPKQRECADDPQDRGNGGGGIHAFTSAVATGIIPALAALRGERMGQPPGVPLPVGTAGGICADYAAYEEI
jgi:hypothetical protein